MYFSEDLESILVMEVKEMKCEEYFKRHPFLIKQIVIPAFAIAAVTVPLIENRLEAEHRFYRDDLPAHNCFYESPSPAAGFVVGITSSTLSLQFVNLL